MSYCTTILISFELCGSPSGFRDLAWAHRQRQPQKAVAYLNGSGDAERPSNVLRFLHAIVAGGCIGHGAKGDVVSWGCVGNYVSQDDFVRDLLPFLVDAWQERFISQYGNVIVMFQCEQKSSIEAYEIGLRNRSGETNSVTKADIVVQGGRIQFPVWDAIDRQTSYVEFREVDQLPVLNLEDE